MMNVPLKLATFTLVLLAVFAASWLAGAAWGPEAQSVPRDSEQHQRDTAGHAAPPDVPSSIREVAS